jgi:Flp pilus assembly protein CpaB
MKDGFTRSARWRKLLAWTLFGAGLLVQLLTPRLEIVNGAFVMPPVADGESIRPDEIVATERRTRMLSAILTVSGAVALAYCYRHSLLRRK